MSKGRVEKTRAAGDRVEKYCSHCKQWKDRETEFSPKRGGGGRSTPGAKRVVSETLQSGERKMDGRFLRYQKEFSGLLPVLFTLKAN